MNNQEIMTTHLPEYHTHEEFKLRSQKLADIRKLGINPYPHKFTPTQTAKQMHDTYGSQDIGHSEQAQNQTSPFASCAGRLVLFRSMGKNAFGQLQDESGRIQVMFNKESSKVLGLKEVSNEDPEALTPMKFIEKKLDLGDIIGVSGNLFHTNKGELTLFVHKVELLCKTLLPLADKHSGLADKELRYRKRWLDLITNQPVADTFRLRSKIVSIIRQYMAEHEFMEVETPVLQSIYGGAEAAPFETTLNALNQDMFLRISLEIPLKKLIVGGMTRVFELGKVFRNEGIDRTHNPEFTMMEAYAAFWDYNDTMHFTEQLFETIALKLYGKTTITIGDPEQEGAKTIDLDLKAPWKRLTMKDAIKTYGKIDVDTLSDEQMRKMLLDSNQVDPKKLKDISRGLLIAAMFEVYAEEHLIQPHHIIDHPIDTTPLCKLHREEKQHSEGFVERFESFILGKEICNSYTELNDPEIQRELLVKQADRRLAGDKEASPLDEEFIEAICQGMPPTGGVGIGIDRLVMILTNTHSIRDVLFFPWMKPE